MTVPCLSLSYYMALLGEVPSLRVWPPPRWSLCWAGCSISPEQSSWRRESGCPFSGPRVGSQQPGCLKQALVNRSLCQPPALSFCLHGASFPLPGGGSLLPTHGIKPVLHGLAIREGPMPAPTFLPASSPSAPQAACSLPVTPVCSSVLATASLLKF